MAGPHLGHCKLCDLPDFKDPELRDLIRDVYASDRDYFGDPDFPSGREYRKYWEVAMTLRSFGDLGVLRDDARVLGVGAGHEATIYWLTEKVGKVFATDRYRTEDAWSEGDSGADMLTDPGRYWDGPWKPDRLVVQDMDALELEYEDESFDGVFSSSSIEHFGGWGDVRQSVEEIHRVLRPGGVAALSTEFRLEGPAMGQPGALMFDEAELRALLLDGLWWDPATPLDTGISEEALGSAVPFQAALADLDAGIRGWSRYPHVVLRDGDFLWTSVHVALVKSGLTAAKWRLRAPSARRGGRPRHTQVPAVSLWRRSVSRGYQLLAGIRNRF